MKRYVMELNVVSVKDKRVLPLYAETMIDFLDRIETIKNGVETLNAVNKWGVFTNIDAVTFNWGIMNEEYANNGAYNFTGFGDYDVVATIDKLNGVKFINDRLCSISGIMYSNAGRDEVTGWVNEPLEAFIIIADIITAINNIKLPK